MRGTIFNKFVQILAYADHVDMIIRTMGKSGEVFSDVATVAGSMGSEAWTIIEADKSSLLIFERNDRLKIFGTSKNGM